MAKSGEKKGKKEKKNKPTSKKYSHYIIDGDTIKRSKNCPRCGPGIFLGIDKKGGRAYCGKCHYTEFPGKKEEKKEESKKEEPKAEEKKEEKKE